MVAPSRTPPSGIFWAARSRDFGEPSGSCFPRDLLVFLPILALRSSLRYCGEHSAIACVRITGRWPHGPIVGRGGDLRMLGAETG